MTTRRKSTTHKVEQGKQSVYVTRLKSKRIVALSEKTDVLDVEVFQADPAFVRISHGVTKNIGDYESLRVDVAVTVPCYREQVDAVTKDLGEYVATVLERELDAYGVDLHG